MAKLLGIPKKYLPNIKIQEQTASLKKKCGHHDLFFMRLANVGRKVGVKAATFFTGLPLRKFESFQL